MSDAHDVSAPPPAAPRRWLGPAFLVSMVINLFLLGLIASALWMHHEPRGGHGPSSFFFGGSMSDLSKEDRTALRQMMRAQFKTIQPHLKELDQSRTDLAKVIGETPYDPTRVSAVFARIEQAQSEIGQVMREAMIKGFGEMSDAQRQRLAKAMERNAEHKWNRRRAHHRDRADDDQADGPAAP